MTTSTTARLVHSKKSMTAVVEREKRRLRELEALTEAKEDDDEGTVDLYIARHDGAEEAKRQRERHLAANLPYKNRNPYV